MIEESSQLFQVEPVVVDGPLRRSHARRGFTKFRDPVPDRFGEVTGVEIPADHIVRRLARVISEADLSHVLRLYAHRGGTPYPPLNLLAVMIYGMMDGALTCEKLEERCIYDARYRFLMGGLTPDYRTFGRFRERIDSCVDEVFNHISRVLRGQKKNSGTEVIIDGAKVSSNVSWWKYCKGSEVEPPDPDARLQNSHGRKMVGYNAQVVVDSCDTMIVAADVVSDQGDEHVADRMMEAMKIQFGSYPCAVIADQGFESTETIEALEEKGIDTVFAWDERLPECLDEDAEGVLRCPAGKQLVKIAEHPNGSGTLYDHYKPKGGCRGCPLASSCRFKSKMLYVKHDRDAGARFRNRARVQSITYEDAMFKRRRVERVFARMKRDGLVIFYRRTRARVRTTFLIWALSYNLRVTRNAKLMLFALRCRFSDAIGSCRDEQLSWSKAAAVVQAA